MRTPGFFVDWNGDTRPIASPGGTFECIVDVKRVHVDVVDSQGFVVHECSYFPTLEAVEAAGVVVNLVQ